MGKISTLLRVVPGPVVFWALTWLDLFARTPLLNPGSALAAQNTAALLGAIFAVIAAFTLAEARAEVLRWLAWSCVILAIVAFIACAYFWYRLGGAPGLMQARPLQDLWFWASVAGMTLVIAALSVAGLLIPEGNRWLWAAVGGAVAAVIVCILIYFLFLR